MKDGRETITVNSLPVTTMYEFVMLDRTVDQACDVAKIQFDFNSKLIF